MPREELLKKAIELSSKIEELKATYKELDSVIEQLIATEFRTGVLDGHVITIIDNFRDRNTAFRVHGIRRFELYVHKVVKT